MSSVHPKFVREQIKAVLVGLLIGVAYQGLVIAFWVLFASQEMAERVGLLSYGLVRVTVLLIFNPFAAMASAMIGCWVAFQRFRRARIVDLVSDPQCLRCGYSIGGLDWQSPRFRCPECGFSENGLVIGELGKQVPIARMLRNDRR